MTIVDHWQHRDVTLEDFSFTLAVEGGRQVQVDFIESSPRDAAAG